MEVKEILEWIDNNPFKEALLITEAPIGRTTLTQLKSGAYQPSPRMLKALKGVIMQYPEGKTIPGGYKATGS